jgi:uncharacterized delta-60 repeat protein
MKFILRLCLFFAAASCLSATPPGSLDPSFGTKGRVITNFTSIDSVADMVVQSDDKIVVVGYTNNPTTENVRVALARYKANGALDSTFGQGGKVITSVLGEQDAAYATTLQPDGKILVAASVLSETGFHTGVLRYLSNGTLDGSFGSGGKVTFGFGTYYDTPHGIAVQPDDKILVVGASSSAGHEEALLIRLNSNGTLDTSFNGTGIVKTNIRDNFGDTWVHVIPLAEGKILTSGSSQGWTIMARYQTDGSLDPSFGTGGKLSFSSFSSSAMQLLADDKIALSIHAHPYAGLARLHANGVLDNSFGINGIVKITLPGTNPRFSDLAIQADGKFVVTGDVTDSSKPDWHSNLLLARCLEDGSLDSDFGVGGVSIIDNKGDSDFYGVVSLLNEGRIMLAATRLYDASRPSDPLWGPASDFALYRFTVKPDGHIVFSENPQSQFLPAGEYVTLTALVRGDAPIKQVWIKNGVAIPGSYGPQFSPPPVTIRDAGIYTSRASNALGSTVSEPALVAVMETAPAMLVVDVNERASMTCSIAAPAGTKFTYQWYVNGTPLQPTPGLKGEDTKTLVITKMHDDLESMYGCLVTMIAPDQSIELYSGETQLQRPEQPEMTDFSIEGLSVGTRLNFTVPYAGNPNHFTITGLPPGLTYDPTTGIVSGRPLRVGTYTAQVVASNQAGASRKVTATIEVIPFLESGRYAGIIDRNSSMDGGKGLGGILDITVTSKASVSGKIIFGGVIRNVVGNLDAEPQSPGNTSTLSLRIPAKGGLPAVQLLTTLAFDGEDGNSIFDDFGNSSAVHLYKQQFSSPDYPATRYQGTYTWLMDGAQTPQVPSLPAGIGYMTAKVLSSGVIQWTGRLADNTILIGSSFLGGAPNALVKHAVPIHHALYNRLGSLQGHVILDAEQGDASPIDADGTLEWMKLPVPYKNRSLKVMKGGPISQPLSASDRSYREGFVLHELKITGGQYSPPAPGACPLNLPVVTPPARNAELVFSGAGLQEEIERLLTITPNNEVSFAPASPAVPAMTLTLSPSTGALTGRMPVRAPDPGSPSRTISFTGVLVPRLGIGAGFFMLPQLPSAGPPATTQANSPILSGKVLLQGIR